MSVTCEQLVEAARKSASAANCEADWRGVCARSYYAIYHAGKAFWEHLAADGFPGAIPQGTRAGRHVELYTRLKNPTLRRDDLRYKTSWRLGVMMMNLHSLRTTADYFPNECIDQIAAANTVETAKNVLSLIAGQPFGSAVSKFDGNITRPTSIASADTPAELRASAPVPNKCSGFLKVVKPGR